MRDSTGTLTASIVVMVLLLITAGCLGEASGPIVAFSGEMNASDAGFEMNGEIQDQSIRSEYPRFEGVGVYLYREDKTLIKRVDIGTLQGSTNISITTNEVPKYIIIYSPDFWKSGWFGLGSSQSAEVSYYMLGKEYSYIESVAGSKSDLPVQPKSSGATETAAAIR